MKKTLANILIILLFLFTNCDTEEKEKLYLNKISLLEQQINEKQREINDANFSAKVLRSLIAKINDSIQGIIKTEQEFIVLQSSSEKEPHKRALINQGEEILVSIERLDSILKAQNSRISALKSELSAAKIHNNNFVETLTELEKTISIQENRISELQYETELLVKRNSKLEEEITDLRKKNETVHFIVKKESYLLSNQIMLRRKKFLSSSSFFPKKDFQTSNFIEANKFLTSQIEIPSSKNINIVSSHPAESYWLERIPSKNASFLNIKDPIKFWSFTKYLIISYK